MTLVAITKTREDNVHRALRLSLRAAPHPDAWVHIPAPLPAVPQFPGP